MLQVKIFVFKYLKCIMLSVWNGTSIVLHSWTLLCPMSPPHRAPSKPKVTYTEIIIQ